MKSIILKKESQRKKERKKGRYVNIVESVADEQVAQNACLVEIAQLDHVLDGLDRTRMHDAHSSVVSQHVLLSANTNINMQYEHDTLHRPFFYEK